MFQNSPIIRQELAKLLPASIINEIACFVFYENHPREEHPLDITICTKNCELKEFFQRDTLLSIDLQSDLEPKEIQIYWNLKSELFYLVSTKTELFIVSSKKKCVVKKILGVEKYWFDDSACTGHCSLKVVTTDDAVPVTYDDNFDIVEDRATCSKITNDESAPIIIELKRKLTEAKYSYQCNLKTLKDYQKLRQQAMLANCSILRPNQEDSVFKGGEKYMGALKIKQKPWIKTCNQKLLIMVPVVNEYQETPQEIQIFITSKSITSSLVYTTKLFEKRTTPPFWRECNQRALLLKEFFLICVMDVSELKSRVTSRIDISVAISYKVMGKDLILPLDDIRVSSLDCMGDEFEALSGEQCDQNTILSILSSTKKVELILVHTKQADEPSISYIDTISSNLHMDKVYDNVIMYRKSPYHVLNGLMMVFDDGCLSEKPVPVLVYARSSSQVLALIHLIHDSVPHKIIATTPNISMNQKLNYKEYASSMLKSTNIILEYLDTCIKKMGESKDPAIISKIGTQIDLFACGRSKFLEFKKKLEEETEEGIRMLFSDRDDSENAMVID